MRQPQAQAYVAAASEAGRGNVKGSFSGRLAEIEPISAKQSVGFHCAVRVQGLGRAMAVRTVQYVGVAGEFNSATPCGRRWHFGRRQAGPGVRGRRDMMHAVASPPGAGRLDLVSRRGVWAPE